MLKKMHTWVVPVKLEKKKTYIHYISRFTEAHKTFPDF